MNSENERDDTPDTKDFLRKEVWEERIRIKMTVDYYGAIAERRTLWIRLIQGLSLLTSSSAIYAAFSSWSEATIILAAISAVCSAISIASGWQTEAVRFLDAQGRARDLEVKWDGLWIRVNTVDMDEDAIVRDINEYKSEYSKIEQHTQPHYQRKRLAKKIQKRILSGLSG